MPVIFQTPATSGLCRMSIPSSPSIVNVSVPETVPSTSVPIMMSYVPSPLSTIWMTSSPAVPVAPPEDARLAENDSSDEVDMRLWASGVSSAGGASLVLASSAGGPSAGGSSAGGSAAGGSAAAVSTTGGSAA